MDVTWSGQDHGFLCTWGKASESEWWNVSQQLAF